MLIIEGADLVGKTTLAHKLVKELDGHVYKHFSRLPESFDYFWGYVENAVTHSVQDRFHMSEVPYALCRGEEPRVRNYEMLSAYLRCHCCAFTVVLYAEDRLIEERYVAEREMYDLSQVLSANRWFYDVDAGKFDMRFHYRKDRKQWPDDEDIELILRRYRERLSAFELEWTRRPSWLR